MCFPLAVVRNQASVSSVWKSTAVLAVSGRLVQASRGEEDLQGLLMPEPQQTMEKHHAAKQLSEPQMRMQTTNVSRWSDLGQLMSELEVHFATQTEAMCKDNVSVAFVELSGASQSRTMTTFGSHTADLAERVISAFTGSLFMQTVPKAILQLVADWAHDMMKPRMRKSLGQMVGNKTLTKRLTAMRNMVLYESPEVGREVIDRQLRWLNERASGHGEYEKVSFRPPLVPHLQDGSPLHAIEGIRFSSPNLTADTYAKFVDAYKMTLKEVKKRETGTEVWRGHRFSKKLRAASKGQDFFITYAKAVLEDGKFRQAHIKAIGKKLGVGAVDRRLYGLVARHGMDMLRDRAVMDQVESAHEVADQHRLLGRMQSTGKDPLQALIDMAKELEEEGEEEEGDDHKESNLDEFIDDVLPVLGWMLKHDQIKAGLQRLVEDFARYMDTNTPEFVQVHNDGSASLLETPTNLLLAPDQKRMLSCHASKTAYTALLQLNPMGPDEKRHRVNGGSSSDTWLFCCLLSEGGTECPCCCCFT
mmetsp:Transcript_171045/g.415737  ORF Transcript_171045/g.415737 Transcript_171045/m.415737 type:complete len:531 (+) Transcript_171045:41-1633(+)